jgi:WD40 repeat protein
MFALARDGRRMAWMNRDAPGAYSVRVADLTTGKHVHMLHQTSGGRVYYGTLTFAPDGKVLAGGLGDRIYLWDLETGKELRHWVADPRQVTSLTYAPGGRFLASSGAETAIRLWDPATGKGINQAQ